MSDNPQGEAIQQAMGIAGSERIVDGLREQCRQFMREEGAAEKSSAFAFDALPVMDALEQTASITEAARFRATWLMRATDGVPDCELRQREANQERLQAWILEGANLFKAANPTPPKGLTVVADRDGSPKRRLGKACLEALVTAKQPAATVRDGPVARLASAIWYLETGRRESFAKVVDGLPHT